MNIKTNKERAEMMLESLKNDQFLDEYHITENGADIQDFLTMNLQAQQDILTAMRLTKKGEDKK